MIFGPDYQAFLAILGFACVGGIAVAAALIYVIINTSRGMYGKAHK